MVLVCLMTGRSSKAGGPFSEVNCIFLILQRACPLLEICTHRGCVIRHRYSRKEASLVLNPCLPEEEAVPVLMCPSLWVECLIFQGILEVGWGPGWSCQSEIVALQLAQFE